MKNISISIDNSLAQFVQGQISDGRYENVNDVIKAGLQLLVNEECGEAVLKNAIQEGIDSGIADDFDPVRNLQNLKRENS